jgi:hypothetical protein
MSETELLDSVAFLRTPMVKHEPELHSGTPDDLELTEVVDSRVSCGVRRRLPWSVIDRSLGCSIGSLVVLVDTCELLEPLDDWLREEFVPGLSDGSVLVIAGRRPLPQGWLSDPAWRGNRPPSAETLPALDTPEVRDGNDDDR